jgi:DNA mismatch repair protein MutS2
VTAEAVALRRLKPNFAIGSVQDIDPLLEAARRGAQLSTGELNDVLSFLRSARFGRNQLTPLARELPQLSHIAQRIGEFVALIDAISGAITPRGEVLDSASAQLPALRRASRDHHDRLLSRVQRILDRALRDGIAQDSIVTERDGRYVIPIKADARSHIPSVVHDVSSSGATVFVEPLAVVELGNAWRESRLEEERAIERILRHLSGQVGAEAGTIVASVHALGEIDFALAKSTLRSALDAALPVEGDSLDWLVDSPAQLRLQSARHPLLKGDVVPISLLLGGEDRAILITGPNTGGKTVALKTVGLLTIMAAAGLPIPAEPGTQIPAYTDLFADIGDEQSIEQSLSTFSGHMTNIIRILAEAGPQSLVLLDELGAGTDPSEGAALGRAILRYLLDADAAVIATTHHGELKVFAHNQDAVINASAEFDPETLAPTYRLRMGLPGRSNALAIAARLGMPVEVLDDARTGLSPDAVTVENLLADLQLERSAASDERRAEEFARREAEEIREQLGRRRDATEGERQTVLARTEREMESELIALRHAIRDAEKQLAKQSKQSLLAARDALAGAEQRLDNVRTERARSARAARRTSATKPPDPSTIAAGDFVLLEGFEQPGEVLGAVDDSGRIEIQLGALRTRVGVEQVLALADPRHQSPSAPVTINVQPVEPVSRIEVRGQTLDEALPAIEQFLDHAYRAGLQRLEVVHGKGTGTLRRAVREMLRNHPLVSAYEPAERREGGDGVTIVRMAV